MRCQGIYIGSAPLGVDDHVRIAALVATADALLAEFRARKLDSAEVAIDMPDGGHDHEHDHAHELGFEPTHIAGSAPTVRARKL